MFLSLFFKIGWDWIGDAFDNYLGLMVLILSLLPLLFGPLSGILIELLVHIAVLYIDLSLLTKPKKRFH